MNDQRDEKILNEIEKKSLRKKFQFFMRKEKKNRESQRKSEFDKSNFLSFFHSHNLKITIN